MTALISWVLLAWMCNGSCRWELVGQWPEKSQCNTFKDGLARYAVCLEMKVPAPGSPR